MISWSPSGVISAYLASISRDLDAMIAKGVLNQTHCRIQPPALVSFQDRNIAPDAFYHPNVFVWYPQILRQSLQIRCPNCDGTDTTDRGWISRRIVDLNASFFIMAKEFACARCSDLVFSTCDINVLSGFSSDLQAAFPAIMLPATDGGLSRTLVNFIQACCKFSLSLDAAHAIVADMHMSRYIERKAAFEASVAHAIQNDVTESSSDDGSMVLSESKFFSSFDDRNGYGGFIPPPTCLKPFSDGKGGVRPDAVLWTGSVVVAATEIATNSIVPAISIEKRAPTIPDNTSPDTGSREPKRKRRPRRCQNRITVNGEVVICGLMDCPGRGGQKFCRNFTGSRQQNSDTNGDLSMDAEDLSKLSTLATLIRPVNEVDIPVRECELLAMEALQNMI